jgi:hypothetical protein
VSGIPSIQFKQYELIFDDEMSEFDITADAEPPLFGPAKLHT